MGSNFINTLDFLSEPLKCDINFPLTHSVVFLQQNCRVNRLEIELLCKDWVALLGVGRNVRCKYYGEDLYILTSAKNSGGENPVVFVK